MKESKTRTEIAEEFGISRRTLLRWLKKEKIELPKRLITPAEQSRIYSRFGRPRAASEEVEEKKNRFGGGRSSW